MRRQLIVDTETTGLAPDHAGGTGMIWEIAVVERDTGTEHLWRMEPDLAKADPAALRKNRYYERTARMRKRDERVHDLAAAKPSSPGAWSNPALLARDLARMLDDATLIGAVPSFDAGFLAAFLRHHGQAPSWHYRLRDLGSMAWAWLHARALGAQFLAGPGYEPDPEALGDLPAAPLPLDASTDDFAAALGVKPDRFDRHTALGDCRLVAACMDVIEGVAR